MNDTLSKVPVLRILIPFTTGILSAYYINISTTIAIIAVILSIMAFVVLSRIKTPRFRLNHGYAMSLPIILLCFALGIINANRHNKHEDVLKYGENCIAQASILKITDLDFSANMHIKVTTIIDSYGKTYHLNEKMTAWIEGNDYNLAEGDLISFRFQPQRIKNNGNPEEFDYAGYMANKGFIYHVFIRQNDYRKTGHENNILSYSSKIQRQLKNKLLESHLSPEVKSFFIAILLGEPSAIKDETKINFSYAGIAHILALSGLHIGIIALLLNIFLFPLDYYNRKKVRFGLTLATIVIYAFISGLSVSVIRATIMIGFLVIARIMHRKNTPLNALFTAALIILLVSPFAIFDIGFQFSFITVLFILLLSKKLIPFSPKQEMLYFISSIFIISAISTIGTISLTAYYFNHISILSLFSNVLLIPVLPIIVGFGIIYIVTLCLEYELTVFTECLNTGYKFIMDVSSAVTNTPYSYIDNIYISTAVLGLAYVSLLFLILFIYKRKTFYIYGFIVIIIGVITLRQLELYSQPENGYVIFNDNSHTPVLAMNGDTASLLIPDNVDFSLDSFKDMHRKFISKYNINTIKIDSVKPDSNGVIYMTLGNNNTVIISGNAIKHLSYTPRIKSDMLIITKKYYGRIEDLLRCYDPKLIVLSGNIYHKKHDELSRECHEKGIKYHSLSETGAISDFFN